LSDDALNAVYRIRGVVSELRVQPRGQVIHGPIVLSLVGTGGGRNECLQPARLKRLALAYGSVVLTWSTSRPNAAMPVVFCFPAEMSTTPQPADRPRTGDAT
jgi:hypothetical protein